MKASEILAAKGFGYASDSDLIKIVLRVWSHFPMPFEQFLEVPLPAYWEMQKATVQHINEDREFQIELFKKVFGGKR